MAKDARVRYWARRGGWEYFGTPVDRGQIVELQGAINDEKLIRLGFVAELEKGMDLVQCGRCGKEFVGNGERTAHGELRHLVKPDWVSDEEWELEQEKKIEHAHDLADKLAPLNLAATKASAKS